MICIYLVCCLFYLRFDILCFNYFYVYNMDRNFYFLDLYKNIIWGGG